MITSCPEISSGSIPARNGKILPYYSRYERHDHSKSTHTIRRSQQYEMKEEVLWLVGFPRFHDRHMLQIHEDADQIGYLWNIYVKVKRANQYYKDIFAMDNTPKRYKRWKLDWI